MSEIIKTENLQYAYPTEDGQLSVPVLKGVNLSIRRGAFVAVLGHNGSGKSTLAKLLGQEYACRLLQRDPSADRRRMLR